MNPLIPVGILLITFLMCGASFADGCGNQYHPCTNGIDGKDGLSIKGDAGKDGIGGSYFNSNQLTQAIAINGAIANIPTLSHAQGAHKHTGAGFGVSNYANETALSVGFLHQYESLSYKLTFGMAGNQRIVGSGLSVAF